MSSNLMFAVPNFPGKAKIVSKASRLALQVSKHSPELMVAGGIVCGVGATVMACRATLHLEDTLCEYNSTMENIRFMESKIEDGKVAVRDDDGNFIKHIDYTPEDVQRDKFVTFVKTAVKVGKLYAPAIILTVASAGLVLGGHHILMKRNTALGLAYTALQKAYDEYRGRVREAVGEEMENDIYNGVRAKVIETTNDKGKTKKETVHELEHPASPYTRIFDESNPNWSPNPENNKFFLTQIQRMLNDQLRIKGHVFLNDALRALGFSDTPMGAITGWVYGEGDSFISFGIWDATKEGARRFINCDEASIWLDFNCDGVIYDII